ncbi:MAG TPA: aspartate/glutamate racemase family protein [Thermoanaerobaculia bacterium]
MTDPPELLNAPTIGILAGMGPHSTAPFLELLLAECKRQYGAVEDIDFPPIVIRSQPTPFYTDRATDHAAMATAVRDGLQKLARNGVDYLAIACNTAHIYFDELAASVDLPLLDMVELTVSRLQAIQRVALVAARPTADAGIYQRRLLENGMTAVDLDCQADVDALLLATRTDTTPVQFAQLWSQLTRKAESASVEALVVACLDLSATVRYAVTTLPIVDASQCLAEGLVREWLERRKAASK